MAATSGTIDLTAVSVRTGTIMTGNPVETISTGNLVPVICSLVSRRTVATSNRSLADSTAPRNCGFGCDMITRCVSPLCTYSSIGDTPMLHSYSTRVTGSFNGRMPSLPSPWQVTGTGCRYAGAGSAS